MFCPTFELDGVPQIKAETMASLNELISPDGVKAEMLIGLDNPYPGERHRNTLHQYQSARTFVLSGGYDALLTIEHDMIVPPDALIKLWETDAPVVYAPYVLRHGMEVCNVLTYVAGSKNIGESISRLSIQEREQIFKQTTIPCSGVGFGCTLIRREVLERFEFHDSTGNPAPDMGLAVDCQREGIKQAARMDAVCGHINDNGLVLWPGKEFLNMAKYKIFTNFYGTVGTRSVQFRAGEVVDLPQEVGHEYVRAGFAEEILDAPPAIKVVNKGTVLAKHRKPVK